MERVLDSIKECTIAGVKQTAAGHEGSVAILYSLNQMNASNSSPYFSFPLVDLNQAWAKDGIFGNRVRRCEWAGSLGHRGNGQAIHEELVEWELGIEGNSGVLDGDIGDGLDDREILLVDVDDGEGGVVGGVSFRAVPLPALPAAVSGVGVGVADGDREFQSLRRGLDVLGIDGESPEDGKRDLTNVWARAWHDEVLVESREGKLAGARSEEGKGAWDLAEKFAVEAILLALLADNGNDTTN